MTQMLVNKMITPDGTVIYSRHRHDYTEYVDKNGELYVLDGGLDYTRTSSNKVPATYAPVYDTDSHDLIREEFSWGSYGKDGKQPLTRRPLKDLEDDHIEAILATQHQIPQYIRKIFLDEQQFRVINQPIQD